MIHRLALLASAAGLALAAGLCCAAPAAAQAVEEVTVFGHGPKQHPDTLSYRVTYNDLDLRAEPGQRELRRRVSISASYVCRKLRQDGKGSTCRADAVREASPKIDAAIKRAHVHQVKWTPGTGPVWAPPPGYK